MDIHTLGSLFEDVQLQSVFSDGKLFVDCIPKHSLEKIKTTYEADKSKSDFDLKAFVTHNFDLPPLPATGYKSDTTKPIEHHINELWDILTRKPTKEQSTLISLPHPYIVPGGRFREIYYWDSYFTMLGLQVSGKIDLIENMVDNFSFLIDTYGYIPNGNRTYFLGRSQPPFYSLMVKLLSEAKDSNTLKKYMPQLETEYKYWMKNSTSLSASKTADLHVVRMPDGSILNRYWDENATPRPESFKEDVELTRNSKQESSLLYRNLRAACESGWDFSSRWFKNQNEFGSIHTTEIIPVDLNCLLLHLEETLAEGYRLLNETSNHEKFLTLASQRKSALLHYCWNEDKKFFFDYDFISAQQKEQFTLAACFPLFFKVASAEQARKVADIVEHKFLQVGGLTTTLEFAEQQWDAPNGWAPLQWIAVKGLLNYDLSDLATKIKTAWMATNAKVYKATGKMTEKYNVYSEDAAAGGGEYPNQDGFGWTNGVYLAMAKL